MSNGVVIVTGGAGDVGRGVCRALTDAGSTVVAFDLEPARAEGVARAVRCDVTDRDASAAAVEEVVREFGGLTGLVNLAQQWTKTPLMETTVDDWFLSHSSGPFATFQMMQLCYPHLITAGGGAIVNCGSASGTQGGVAGEAAYAAAKEAIRGLTKHAAIEWGPDGISVNVICPLATHDPDRWNAIGDVAGHNPMRRLGDPEADVGALVVYLLGPGRYMTGRTLHIDGGVGTFR